LQHQRGEQDFDAHAGRSFGFKGAVKIQDLPSFRESSNERPRSGVRHGRAVFGAAQSLVRHRRRGF
jgi:hypothetical protein